MINTKNNISKTRLAIIGAGNIAKEHLKVLESIKDIELVGITSRTIVKAEELANKFNIDKVYDNIFKLIDEVNIDGIMILVSADQIFNVSKDLIALKIPLFIEKPAGLFPKETKQLSELARKHSTLNMVGYNRRYYSIFHKGIEIIKQKGDLLGISIEGHERFWNIDGKIDEKIQNNWVYANSTHTIDLLRFFGGEVANIHSMKNSVYQNNGDQFASIMEFKSKVLGHYISHWYSPGGWSVTLFGDKITVRFEPLEKGVYIDSNFNEHEIKPEKIDKIFKPGFYNQIQAFLSMIKTGELQWPGQDLNSAYKTMVLSDNIANNYK